MQAVEFTKMSGCGNDFIIIDNRKQVIDEQDLTAFIVALCRRKLSVGADGLILIEASSDLDFRWRFFNSDGSRAEMCGNGARCAARFAHLNGIAGANMVFGTDVGPIQAQVVADQVKLQMVPPRDLILEEIITLPQGELVVSFINTGVPHVVVPVSELDQVDVVELGRTIRNHPRYAPAGSNVNFLGQRDGRTMAYRTYERGVEDETLACGTGAVAAALVSACREKLAGPFILQTRGGKDLKVHFERDGENFSDVFLEGEARFIYQGRLDPEAWA